MQLNFIHSINHIVGKVFLIIEFKYLFNPYFQLFAILDLFIE